jgi:N-acetylmuramoyl-L-alanine amidase
MVKFVKLLILIMLLISARNIYALESTKEQYDKFLDIQQKEKKLFSKSKNLKEKEIITIAEKYKSIYTNYPKLKIADDALRREASVYERAYRIFLKDNYRSKAIELYKKLVSDYPKSPFGDDAIYSIAVLEWEKRNNKQALSYIKQLLDLYPNSNLKAKALELSSRIEKYGKQEKNVSSKCAVIKNIRHWTGKRYTRVVIDVDRQTNFSYGTLMEPDRLFIDINSAVLTSELIRQKIDVKEGFLQAIRTGQFSETTSRIVLDFDKIKRFDIFSLDNPFRIVVDIYADDAEAKVDTAAEKEMGEVIEEKPAVQPYKNSDGTYSLVRQLGLGIKRIVIDAGHGGKDPGAIGVNGLKEKDVTLAIAKVLAELLTKEGYEVHLTRDKDVYLTLEERTAIANSLEADLFISIHANSSRNRRLRGIETYYLNFAVSESEMEVAARENATSEKSVGELQKLIKKIMLNSKIKESMDFATIVHRNIIEAVRSKHDTVNLGVKKAPFYVLIGAQMPSILLEVSFLSNPVDAKKLQDKEFTFELAEGIKKGIMRYGAALSGTVDIGSLQ